MTQIELRKLDYLDNRIFNWQPFPSEKRSCPFCGEYSIPLFLRPDNLPVSQCNRCRCFYVSLKLYEETLNNFYESYWSENHPRPLTDEMAKYLIATAGFRASMDTCIRKLTALHSICNETQVLDIGCGFGEKATMLSSLGASVIGLDISESAVRFMKEQLGIEAYQSSIENWDSKGTLFDVVTMFEFIEHPLDPLRSLMTAINTIRPGGLLVIVTPNGTAGDRKVFSFNDEWSGFRTDLEHMQYLHIDTIDYLAHKLGCRILHCDQFGFRGPGDTSSVRSNKISEISNILTRSIKKLPGARGAIYSYHKLQMLRQVSSKSSLNCGLYHLFAVIQKTGNPDGDRS